MVIAILAKIGTRTFAVAVFDATFVIVTCNMFFYDGKGPKAWILSMPLDSTFPKI